MRQGALLQTLAEKAAWELAQQNGIDLVTICPNFGEHRNPLRHAVQKTEFPSTAHSLPRHVVLGPILSPEADSLSVGFIKVRKATARSLQRQLRQQSLPLIRHPQGRLCWRESPTKGLPSSAM